MKIIKTIRSIVIKQEGFPISIEVITENGKLTSFLISNESEHERGQYIGGQNGFAELAGIFQEAAGVIYNGLV